MGIIERKLQEQRLRTCNVLITYRLFQFDIKMPDDIINEYIAAQVHLVNKECFNLENFIELIIDIGGEGIITGVFQ